MNIEALRLVLDLETKREEQAAMALQQARQQHELQRRRLLGLEQYRLEYLNSALERGKGGLASMRFGHYHAFVSKLDDGIVKQTEALQRLDKVVAQRRGIWMEKQQRRKAVEHLIEKHNLEVDQRQQRQEQKTADEYAMQGFLRRRKA